MLSKEQYNILAPHAGVIKLAAQTKCIPTTAPWESMVNVNAQLGNPPPDGYCGTCAQNLYDLMARLINEYENFVSTAGAIETC